MSRRGYTLVELVVVVSILVAIVTTSVVLYAFAVSRSAKSMSRLSDISALSFALDDIAFTIDNASECVVVPQGSHAALRCVMPASPIDSNSDGRADDYMPRRISSAGYEQYATGPYVWYYLSNNTGLYLQRGTILWRATSAGTSFSAAFDPDEAWTFYYSTGDPKLGEVKMLELDFDNDDRTARITITLEDNAISRPLRVNTQTGFSMSRVVYWRNWR